MSETGPDRAVPIAVLVPVVLLVLPLIYVASFGPVARLASGLHLPIEALRAFYAPLVWLHDNTFLEGPFEQYERLWRS
jgi:hypothetical protein